jgi:hypothetical protein
MREQAGGMRSHWPRIAYRFQQFVRGLQANVSTEERRTVARLLPAAALALFHQMPVDAQRHGLNVLLTLTTAGYTQPDLAVAALLHDMGKAAAAQAGIPLNLWWRGPLVLLEAVFPQHLHRWCKAEPAAGWRYLLYVHLEHPRIGAEWAQAAGCTPLTCWLIEHHQEQNVVALEEQKGLLNALQWADGNN